MTFNDDSCKGYLIKQFCITYLAYFKVFAITRNTIRNWLSFLFRKYFKIIYLENWLTLDLQTQRSNVILRMLITYHSDSVGFILGVEIAW